MSFYGCVKVLGVYDSLSCPSPDLLIVQSQTIILSLLREKERLRSHSCKIGFRNLGKHHVYCNRFYKKRTAYFYQRAVNFFVPYVGKAVLSSVITAAVSLRYEDGTHEWLRIPRHQCSNDKCRRIHRMMPDILTPFKHYNEETISGFLDGIVTPEDEYSETCPSEDTMIRWHHWFIINEFNIEGHMKSIGYRLLGFGVELLETGISLLSHMRSSMPAAWLKIVMRYIYNSGNALEAF